MSEEDEREESSAVKTLRLNLKQLKEQKHHAMVRKMNAAEALTVANLKAQEIDSDIAEIEAAIKILNHE